MTKTGIKILNINFVQMNDAIDAGMDTVDDQDAADKVYS